MKCCIDVAVGNIISVESEEPFPADLVLLASSEPKESFTLQALAFLHGLGIAHGNMQPGNMLFGLDEFRMPKAPSAEGEEHKLRQQEDAEGKSITTPVRVASD
ncbi:aminophospholipid translocase [Sporothrix stenoceras]|uniref:Aminophospholipid translocase n=1 Tax=Sporothrix stenoceras TaxID=5173 RepID=A0ABR3ZBB0_9PEZI